MEARAIAARYEPLFPWMIKAAAIRTPRLATFIASQDVEIIIEGFPRSANTYCVSAFEIAQRRPVRIARHLHDPWQVRFGERHGIPTMVLIREPLSAVVSALMRDKRSTHGRLLRDYLRFYEGAIAAHQKAIFVPFELATSNFNVAIDALNQQYGTAFKFLSEGDDELIRASVAEKDADALGNSARDPLRSALPSPEKRLVAQELKELIEERHSKLLNRCREVYLHSCERLILKEGL